MKTRLILFFCLLLSGFAHAQKTVSPQATVEWLRSLVVEGRIGLEAAPAVRPRLFTEKMPDGRTWMELIADTLGPAAGGDPGNPGTAGQWALLDEAATLLLTEAEHLRQLAAARTGNDTITISLTRRDCLAGCARLLQAYKTAAGSVFDSNTAGLGNPTLLPDWLLPADVEIREIAGAGRINLRTGEFSGRLSGTMAIPQFESLFIVPNASFDSKGNFDLTAYGTTQLPPGDPNALTLTVPARRPLTVHFSDDGDFRVAAGVQLDLPNNIRLDAFFDVDDPEYEFGLGFSGGITLKLAKEVMLVRPVVNFSAAAPLTVEALDGFAQFLGSLGKGAENFLANAPELPDPGAIEVGRPPDFAVPETSVPFDVIDAWITMIGNDAVRPTINGAVNATLQPARDIIAGMRAEVAAVQTQLTPQIAEIQQLARLVALNADARNMAELAAAQQTIGVDSTRMLDEIRATSELAAGKAKTWLQNLPPGTDLKTSMAVLRIYVQAAAEASLAGSPQHVDLALAAARVADFRARLLANYGFSPAGAVVDAAKVNALDPSDLRLLVTTLLELSALEQLLGPDTGLAPTQAVARMLFERLRDNYTAAVAEGDIERRAVLALQLLDLVNEGGVIGFPLSNAELEFMSGAWMQTFDAIAARSGDAVTGQKLASSFMEAARHAVQAQNESVTRRRHELFGRTKSKGPDDELPGLVERTFLQRVRGAMDTLQGRGLLTAAVLSGYRSHLSSWLDNARADLASDYPDTASVEAALTDAGSSLHDLADMLAFLDDLVPTDVQLLGRFQTSWQALHIKWTGVAEAQKAHWYLASYARELAALCTRYGNGTDAALTTAFRVAGTEAAAGLSRTVNALAGLLNTVTFEEFAFPLPGDLRIDRASGRVAFNRITGDWEVGFGAKLAFPDSNFTLDVKNATLAKNGNFSLTLGSSGMVPLGGSSKINYNIADFNVSGNTGQNFQFNGNGTLTYDGSPSAGDEFSVGMGAGFNSQTGVVNLNANLNNSPLRFSEDIVLLQGAAGLTFGTQSPQGALSVSGKLGILARQKPLPAAGLSEDDFWLTIDALPTTFSFTETEMRAEFTGGSITLPPDIFSSTAQPGDPPVTVGITGLLCVRYIFATGQVEFCSDPGQPYTLALTNLKLALDQVPGFALTINNATLELSGTQFPVLKNLAANFQFPLPGMNATDSQQNRLVSIDVTGKDWRIDGFPREVSFALAQNLRVADLNGLDVDLLGGNALPGCATTFSLTSQTVGGQQQIQLALNGGMRVAFEQQLIDNADQPGTAVAATACGSFTWDFESLPVFVLSTAQIAGRFALGGPNGIKINGVQPGTPATLTFTGIENLHRLTTLSPFTVTFSGAMEVANFVKFGLTNANLKWDGSSLIPAMTLGGAQTSLGSEAVALAQGFLPVYPTMIGVEFLDPNRPLFPAAAQIGLLDPLNIRLLLSGVVSIPPPVAGAPGGGTPSDLPGLGGSVDNLGITLMRQGNQIVPNFSLNGLGLKLSGVDVPPLGGLNGSLYVGNLNDPANLYFAGSVGGTVNDVGAKISMGVHRSKGLLGAVFDLDVGPAGIPLDGGALGGILLTGGSGGLSFGNTFAQPQHFLDSIQFSTVNGEKQPVNDGSTDAFPPTGAPSPVTYPTTPQVPGGTFNSCITGTFPPATINPLSKPHPTIAGRVIFKGTNLHPTIANTDLGIPITLNSLGITPATVPAGSINSAVTFAVQQITQPVRNFANSLINAVPPVVDAKVKAYYASLLNKQIRQLETSATGFLTQALGQAIGVNPAASFYQVIVDAAAKGMPSLDATLRLQGNFSHAAVSTVLKGKGAVTLSTTGTATLDGAIELIGIPVGEGVLALSITDTQGNINPSFGGVLHAGVGPLTLGDMSMSYQCDGCFTAVLNAFQVFLATNAETMGATSRQLLVAMMNRIVPVTPARALSGDPGAYWMELNDGQKIAFVASLFNIIQVLSDGQPLPPGITAQAVSGFIASFQQFVTSVLLQVNPRFCFQAKVKPALFGFPLVPGPTPLDARFAYERVHDNALNQDFQQISANTVFSPAFIMATLTTGQLALLVPGSDQVNAGFSFRVPAFTPQTVDLAMRDPAQFALNQFTTMVQDSTLTFGYAMMPLGIPLAEGQARIVMPRLVNHPSNPGRPRGFWEAAAPAPYAPPNGGPLATRDEVILAALVRGRLQDPNWRGIRGELDDLFFQPFSPAPPPGSPQERVAQLAANRLNATQMNQLGFAEDYFPHGGIIGASQLQLPAVLAQALPADLIAKVFNPANPTWLADAQNLFTNYLTANSVVGQMAAYIPAPNVPQGFNFATGSPQELIDSLITGDPLAIIKKTAPAGVYPFDQVALAGWMKAQILGMPLGDASVRFDAVTGTFKAQAGITPGSWLTKFLNGSAELEIRKPAILSNPPNGATIDDLFAAMPRKTVQQRFQELQATLASANINTVIATIQDTLPKARVEAGATLQLPPELAQFIQAQGAAGAQFFAFSPGYDRNFQPTNFSPYALAQRRGGLGFRGHFKIGYAPGGTQLFMVDVQDASFAITPPGVGVPFPGLAAQLELGPLQLPGLPRFSNAHVAFNSTPDNGAPFVDIGGVLDPFTFQLGGVPLLTVQALSGGTLSGHLRAYRDDAILGLGSAAEFSISAAKASLPMLGNVAVTMFGEENGGNYTDFSFSTQSGQHWAASIVISSNNNPAAPPTFQIRSPLAPAGTPALMEFTATSRVYGTLSGNGLNDFRLELDVPTGFSATFFPGQETEVKTPVIGGTEPVKVYLDSTGRFYVNLGNGFTDLELPGILKASGTVEFGYNPSGSGPNITGVPSGTRTFPATDILNQSISTFTVTNTGNEQADVTVTLKPFTAGQPAPMQHFHVNRPAFSVAPGQSVPVDIIFHPSTTGGKSGRIEVFSKAAGEGSNDQLFTFALSGSGVSTPVYFQSSDSIQFGDTVVGGNPKATLTVGNKGSATMTSTVGVMSGAGYTVTPTTSASILPGGSRLYTITFEPTAIQNFPGTLTITTGNAGGPYTVNVNGSGSESRWVTLMDSASAGSTATLNDITFLDANRGFVAGDSGTFYETRDRGRSWTPRALTVSSLKDIAVNQTVFNDFIAEYHLDLPQGARIVRDDGPNGHHGGAPSAAQAPLTGTGTGAIGGGLSFDGVDDCVDLAAFDLPSDFAIAFYFKPFDSSNGQCLIGKHTSTGGTQFLFGYFNNVWQLNFRGQVFEMDIPSGMNGFWNQMVLNADYNEATDKTNITLWMRGLELLTIPFNGPIGTFSGGKPWTLGQDWDSSTVRSDFFQGGMDEVYFFSGSLADNEIQALSVGSGGQQVLLTGSDGTVLESGNRGLAFHVPYDMNTTGWRQELGVFRDYDWTAAAVTGASKIVLGGTGPGATLAIRNRLLLLEDLDANDPGFTGDDRYDEVTFDGTADSAVSNSILALFRDNSLSVSPATFALSGSGRIYRTPASGNVWTAHGTVDIAGALRAATSMRFTSSNASNVVVGDGGSVINWAGTGTPNLVPPANVAGGITANLRAVSSFITKAGTIGPRFHAAGDAGTYIISTNAGANWQGAQDGLTGDVRGLHVQHPGAGALITASDYESWTVGTQHMIQHRPWQRPTGSFVTFQPGLLDFGYTKLGATRVLDVKVFNRGRKDLSLNSIQVTGAGFSLGQVASGSVSRIAPGDSVTLQVRYQPSAVSAFDAGDLTFGSNDTIGLIIAGMTNSFRVPLRGRCDNPEWLPVPLAVAGVPVDGEVLEVVMVTETTGYALVGGTGDSRVFKTTNGGAAWTAVTLTPPAGQTYVLQSLDAKRISFDCVLLAGERRNSSNAFVSGVVLRSVNGGNSFSDVTPSGDTGRPFGSVTQYSDSAGVLAAASQGSGADVWYSSNSGVAWAVATDPPTSSYSGGRIALVATPLSGAAPVTNNAHLLALRGSSIFGRTPATQWPWHTTGFPAVSTGRPKLTFKATSPINDIQFGDSVTPSRTLSYGWICGNGGLFYRWRGADANPFDEDSEWAPCENQEVTGRTDLTSVHFHDDSTTGWMSGGSRIFVSADRGETWEVDFDAGEGALLKSIASRKAAAGGAKGWAGGSLGGRAVIWRYVATAVPALPSLLVKDVEIFPATTPGGLSRTVAVNLQNTGSAELRLHNLHLASDDPSSRFRISGTPPASVPASGSASINVIFDPLPDPVRLPALVPDAFLRFDQNPGDVLFLDSSAGVHHAARPSGAPASNDPAILKEEGRRDPFLHLDGNDSIEVAAATGVGGAKHFSVSLWVNPAGTADGQTFVGKHTTAGSDQFLLGFFAGGYQVKLNALTMTTVGLKQAGWQHLAVTAEFISASSTKLSLWRDGELLITQTLATAVTDFAGKPWSIGADWDSTTALNEFLNGSVDDAGIFDRVLTEGEMAALAGKSELCGEHRARLVFKTGSDNGARSVELRATVDEVTRLVVIDTIPKGLQVIVDGQTRTAPVAVAVRCRASDPAREWSAGSLHRFALPAGAQIRNDANGNVSSYEFASWSRGAGSAITVPATYTDEFGNASIVANFALASVTAPALPPPPAPAGGGVAGGGAFDIAAALAGTPRGPFLRLTDGEISVPQLGANGFEMEGELFVSLTKVKGSLSSTAITWPQSGSQKFVDVGSSNWQVDMLAGSHLLLKARPPSVKIFGKHVAPDGEVALSFERSAGADGYALQLTLNEDFRAVENFLEFKRGSVLLDVTVPQTGLPGFIFTLNGGLRVLRLPEISGDADGWAFNVSNSFTVNANTFNISLASLLGQTTPMTIFDFEPFLLTGDLTLRRNATGPVFLGLSSTTFAFNGTPLATVSGSVSTDSTLTMTGSIPNSLNFPVGGNSAFSLRNASGGAIGFTVRARMLPEPQLELEVPSLKLLSNVPGFPSAGLTLPGINFDSSGDFTTGKLALPDWRFEGIDLERPSGGSRDDNYIRLRRVDGDIKFDTHAEIPFLPGTPNHEVSFSFDGSQSPPRVTGSYRGKFGVLSEKASLEYDSDDAPFQFRGTIGDFIVYFGGSAGTVKAGVKNKTTGVCFLGECP